VTRVALLSSEPVRPTMGGIGVRYFELARALPRAGLDVVLLSPASVEESAACGLPPERLRSVRSGGVAAAVADREVVVAQGQLANELVVSSPELPVVIDLYDPWLIENLHYAPEMGLGPYRNDHASWLLQLARGDLFLCSSAEQRLFYLGLLTALGRVNPVAVERDPTLAELLAIVPFGADPEPAVGGPVLPERRPGERRILFGGVYDWYDIDTFLAALERLATPGWSVWVVRHPRPRETPQTAFRRLERAVVERAGWPERFRFVDWVPALRRHGLLAEVDVLAAPHRESIESDLAFRTRYLDALAAGCPVVVSTGGTVARLVESRGAGLVVPVGDASALACALDETLAGGAAVEGRRDRGRELAAEHAWDRVVEPLVGFLRAPRVDPTKAEFAAAIASRAPEDALVERLGRRWRRMVRGTEGG